MTEASYQSAADKVLYKYPKISQIRLSSDPRNFDNFLSIKMKPQRCTSAIYILSLCEFSGQGLHTKMPRTNNCISNVNRRTDGQTDRRTDRGKSYRPAGSPGWGLKSSRQCQNKVIIISIIYFNWMRDIGNVSIYWKFLHGFRLWLHLKFRQEEGSRFLRKNWLSLFSKTAGYFHGHVL